MLVPTVGTDVEVMSISSFPFNFFIRRVLPDPIGPRQTQEGKTGGKYAMICEFYTEEENKSFCNFNPLIPP